MKEELTRLMKEKALGMGFAACGVTPAVFLSAEEKPYTDWLAKGMHAGMNYMERNTGKRLNPALLMEGARSVIVLLYNYYSEDTGNSRSSYRISMYARGKDYHDVIREKLNLLKDYLSELVPGSTTRVFTDSAPLLERALAKQAGLGWIGKNSMLITRKNGSYYFIAELLTDAELEFDGPFGGNYCGDCSRCVDACPTGAITGKGSIDARKCISYLTIENKTEIPESFKGSYEHWIFGCDICQEVCPWNRFSVPHREPAFMPAAELREMTDEGWENLSKEDYGKLFRGSAVERAKYEGLKRNIRFIQKEENHAENQSDSKS